MYLTLCNVCLQVVKYEMISSAPAFGAATPINMTEQVRAYCRNSCIMGLPLDGAMRA
jgi:hypothetical protein